jgi:hypothetical protein
MKDRPPLFGKLFMKVIAVTKSSQLVAEIFSRLAAEELPESVAAGVSLASPKQIYYLTVRSATLVKFSSPPLQ